MQERDWVKAGRPRPAPPPPNCDSRPKALRLVAEHLQPQLSVLSTPLTSAFWKKLHQFVGRGQASILAVFLQNLHDHSRSLILTGHLRGRQQRTEPAWVQGPAMTLTSVLECAGHIGSCLLA